MCPIFPKGILMKKIAIPAAEFRRMERKYNVPEMSWIATQNRGFKLSFKPLLAS